jgi:acetyl/propionyl-CoA carboxylase alpha subunit
MITGIDLVKEQINIAKGEKLQFTQDDLKINGHALELRVCAEDPLNNFLPDTGRLELYMTPKGPGIRVDDGYEQGQDIPIFYDPMLAKLVAHAATREEAIERLCRAIDEYHIKGIKTTLQFGKWAVRTEPFRKGNFDTKFIENYFKPEYLQVKDLDQEKVVALLSGIIWNTDKKKKLTQNNTSGNSNTNWKARRR